MKMYILVKENIPIGNAIVAVAHASLGAYLKYQDSQEIKDWLSGPFYKVVCKVSETEFELAKREPDHVVIADSTMNDAEIAIAFKPREEWPKSFRFLRVYRE